MSVLYLQIIHGLRTYVRTYPMPDPSLCLHIASCHEWCYATLAVGAAINKFVFKLLLSPSLICFQAGFDL